MDDLKILLNEFGNLHSVISEIQLMTETNPPNTAKINQTSNYKVKRQADQLLRSQNLNGLY